MPQSNSSLYLPGTEATRDTTEVAKEQRWQCWDSRSLHTRTICGMGSRAPGSLGPSPQAPTSKKAAPSPAPAPTLLPPQTVPGPGLTSTSPAPGARDSPNSRGMDTAHPAPVL